MTDTTVAKKKMGFFQRNSENVKTGAVVGFSLSGIAVIVAGVVAHLINPALGFISVPLAIQAIITAMIKRAPKTIETLKSHIQKILKDEDPAQVNKFVDDVVSKYTTSTARTNEPIEEQPEMPIPMNAYYYPTSDRYEVTPRVDTINSKK